MASDENGIKDYIGDGVYVEYDGFGIWLHANEPDSEKAVYLEPDVLAALNRFAQRCAKSKETRTVDEDAQLLRELYPMHKDAFDSRFGTLPRRQ